ncbi:unnamed protein product [Gordionus sp. m RMFG-2023]
MNEYNRFLLKYYVNTKQTQFYSMTFVINGFLVHILIAMDAVIKATAQTMTAKDATTIITHHVTTRRDLKK